MQDTANPEVIDTITSTYYEYSVVDDYEELYNTTLGQVLFNPGNYLLGNSYVTCANCVVTWGVRGISNGKIKDGYKVMLSTGAGSYEGRATLRPVVSLKPDIKLTGNSTDGWILSE